MLEKPITYTDFNGVERTDTFFFHLSESALTGIVMGVLGFDAPAEVNVNEVLQAIVARGNANEIISTFEDIIRKSVGQKSADGIRFIQTDDIVDRFMQSNAFQELYLMLLQSDEFRQEFFTGILPAKLAAKAVQARNQPREYSRDELLRMDEREFRNVVGPEKDMSRDHLLIAMQRKNAIV